MVEGSVFKSNRSQVRVISRYGARPESTSRAADIGPDQADWPVSWSAWDAVKVLISEF